MAPQPPRLPPLPEHPPRALLAMEKEVTGIYITGHPLDEHRALLEKMTFSTADLSELEDRPDHGMSLDGQLVEMGGILTEVKGKATKKGAYMGFITLEDLSGQIEGLVFPKVFERYQGGHRRGRPGGAGRAGCPSGRRRPPSCWWRPSPPWRSLDARRPGASSAPPPQGRRSAAPHKAPAAKTDAQWAQEAPAKLFLRLPRSLLADAIRPAGAAPRLGARIPAHSPRKSSPCFRRAPAWCDGSPACLDRLRRAAGRRRT